MLNGIITWKCFIPCLWYSSEIILAKLEKKNLLLSFKIDRVGTFNVVYCLSTLILIASYIATSILVGVEIAITHCFQIKDSQAVIFLFYRYIHRYWRFLINLQLFSIIGISLVSCLLEQFSSYSIDSCMAPT